MRTHLNEDDNFDNFIHNSDINFKRRNLSKDVGTGRICFASLGNIPKVMDSYIKLTEPEQKINS